MVPYIYNKFSETMQRCLFVWFYRVIVINFQVTTIQVGYPHCNKDVKTLHPYRNDWTSYYGLFKMAPRETIKVRLHKSKKSESDPYSTYDDDDKRRKGAPYLEFNGK